MYILRRSANDETKWQQDDRGKKLCSFSVNPDDKRTEKPAKNQNPERERERNYCRGNGWRNSLKFSTLAMDFISMREWNGQDGRTKEKTPRDVINFFTSNFQCHVHEFIFQLFCSCHWCDMWMRGNSPVFSPSTSSWLLSLLYLFIHSARNVCLCGLEFR